MANEISTFEAFLKSELSNIAEVTACVSSRIYNSISAQDAPFPRLVFQVIPLQDDFGQARTPLQTNILCDIQIISVLPLPSTVDVAVAAIKEHFRASQAFVTSGRRISIRHDRPISRTSSGAAMGEYISYRGGTYRAWIS